MEEGARRAQAGRRGGTEPRRLGSGVCTLFPARVVRLTRIRAGLSPRRLPATSTAVTTRPTLTLGGQGGYMMKEFCNRWPRRREKDV